MNTVPIDSRCARAAPKRKDCIARIDILVVVKMDGLKVLDIAHRDIRIDVQRIPRHMVASARTVTSINCAVNRPRKSFRAVAEIDRVPRRIASDRTAAIDIITECSTRQRDRVASGVTAAIGMTAVHLFLHDMCSLVVDKDLVARHITTARRISAKKPTTEATFCECKRIARNIRSTRRILNNTTCCPRANLVVSRNRRMCIINHNIRRRYTLRRRKESASTERDCNEQSQTT